MQAFIDVAVKNQTWNWYAIADSAQHKALPKALLADDNSLCRCLLDAAQGSPLAAQAPHLVQLHSPAIDDSAWKWIARNAPALPCATVIASPLPFDKVFNQLKPFNEVLLPGGDDMFFAFWDPAILATLMGQVDDATLYVKGPVLSVLQRAHLTDGLTGWWYWDRDGALHSIAMGSETTEKLDLPLQLTQQQVDDLVEASVPDHVLHYVELNQAQLISDIEPTQRYGFVRQSLTKAQSINLEAMKDLVNYVCAVLIYKERLQLDDNIRTLLESVSRGEMSLTHALEKMP
jgi:Domain of unknown function (DUF4123)